MLKVASGVVFSCNNNLLVYCLYRESLVLLAMMADQVQLERKDLLEILVALEPPAILDHLAHEEREEFKVHLVPMEELVLMD